MQAQSTALAVREPEVLEPGQPTLSELAVAANREHGAVNRAAGVVLEHAIAAGEALLKAREACPPDGWCSWVEENLTMGDCMANRYMRLAHHADRLHAEGITSIKTAQLYLRGLAGPLPIGRDGHPKEVREQALALVKDGWTQQAAADLLGLNRSLISEWLHPDAARRRGREKTRRLRARARALAAQERERTIKRAVRKAGAPEQELYAMAERMQDVMGQAHREATEPEKRRHYALAGEHYRKMRDEIVRALGVQ